MKLTEKVFTKVRKVRFIYGNKLHTHFVSHEETYSPDDGDGDFAESQTVFVCYPLRGKHNKVGGLMDHNCIQPKLMVGKDNCLIVEKA